MSARSIMASDDSTLVTDDRKAFGVQQVTQVQVNSDLRLLAEGSFADFKVVCGDREWKTHRAILQRCDYFNTMVSEQSSFLETSQNIIRIKEFESFEIDWLLRFIYAGTTSVVQVEDLKSQTVTGSFFETCVRLFTVGDFFCLPSLRKTAKSQMEERCSLSIPEAMPQDIQFLPDLVTGIRAAWSLDRNTGPIRRELIRLCWDLSQCLGAEPSLVKLLDDIPSFAQDLVKALLGCPVID
ncbi:hypothetical protein N0V93_005283 [Gnomoniopsis smithogilvyi]|uniref:BTB domain-containing protein n=1 Tax=Gnomoniopsis smithogilvyi TaxID=1191159 RepID=A0A9W8YWD8_9PEZI|nr:hypothetical protein N0V93_005283 [Gnomoniopsis smithogilvyi]